MVNRMKISPETLLFHLKTSDIPIEVIEKKEKNIHLFLNGEKSPTFNQLVSISKILNIPTGLLLLNDKLENKFEKVDFRTIDSTSLENYSSELRDTIKEMQVKQEFLSEQIDNKLSYIGKYNIENNYIDLVSEVRGILDLPFDFYKNRKQNDFEYLRNKLNNAGVFVFLNGKVKDNTHRRLNLEEFRGFVLADDKAPIIFINQIDSKNGQKFTLVHEFVHLLLGIDGIFNVIDARDYSYDPVEYFVNKITAEILVPQEEILKLSGEYTDHIDISGLSKIFKVSEFVIVRRLYDLNILTKDRYDEIIKELVEELKNFRSNTKKTDGGNYSNNLNFRMDKPFVKYVENAIKTNKISYTEAFSILGVGYKGYKVLTGGDK